MFIISEISIAFSFAPESGTFAAQNADWLQFFGIVGFLLALVQYVLSHRIDIEAVNLYGVKRPSNVSPVSTEGKGNPGT